MKLIHRGKFKHLTVQQRRWLKRRQAIEPAIGHTKADTTGWIAAGCRDRRVTLYMR